MTRHLTLEPIRALSTVTDPGRMVSLRPALHLMWAVNQETGKLWGAGLREPRNRSACSTRPPASTPIDRMGAPLALYSGETQTHDR